MAGYAICEEISDGMMQDLREKDDLDWMRMNKCGESNVKKEKGSLGGWRQIFGRKDGYSLVWKKRIKVNLKR